MNSPRSFGFGPFLLLPERQLLLRDDVPVRIGGRAFDLLTALVERPGELLTKAELMARAWPGTIVEEANLKVNVSALRRVLGERAGAPCYIATVNGRGYRFVASVQTNRSPTAAKASTDAAARIHNLPVGITRIFGRQEAIECVHCELEEALTFSAIQLFVVCAADSLESFKLTDTEAPMVAEICRKLDGIALAIERCLGRVRHRAGTDS